MAKPQGVRRFLRFSLRSLLLVTLAVAAWLGYEVHYARTVERQVGAIRALGGEVEFEPSPWSILRFIEPESYGRQLATATIPADRLADAIATLKEIKTLRELGVVYDGASDVQPVQVPLRVELANVRVIAAAALTEEFPFGAEDKQWLASKARKRYQRFARKVEEAGRASQRIRAILDRLIHRTPNPSWRQDDYRFLHFPDGSVGEHLVISRYNRFLPSQPHQVLAILLIDDKCVDVKCLEVDATLAIEDADGDGFQDLGLIWTPSDFQRETTQTRPGDARQWLGLYAIDPDGYRNLLPQDRFRDDGH